MLGHVICDVCAICMVLSEIGRLGNSEILKKEARTSFCSSGILSYLGNLEKCIRERPVFLFNELDDYTRDHGRFMICPFSVQDRATSFVAFNCFPLNRHVLYKLCIHDCPPENSDEYFRVAQDSSVRLTVHRR